MTATGLVAGVCSDGLQNPDFRQKSEFAVVELAAAVVGGTGGRGGGDQGAVEGVTGAEGLNH